MLLNSYLKVACWNKTPWFFFQKIISMNFLKLLLSSLGFFFLNKCKENVFLNTIFIVMWFSVAKINLLLCKDASGLSYVFYWWKTLISRPSVLVITTVIKLISLGVPTCPSKVSHIVWLSMPMHNSKIKIWCL